MPREFVSRDDLSKRLKESLEAEGLGDVGLGPVRKMTEIGLFGENWWVNVIKSPSPDLWRDAEDVIHRYQKRHSLERRSVERRAVIRRGPAS